MQSNIICIALTCYEKYTYTPGLLYILSRTFFQQHSSRVVLQKIQKFNKKLSRFSRMSRIDLVSPNKNHWEIPKNRKNVLIPWVHLQYTPDTNSMRKRVFTREIYGKFHVSMGKCLLLFTLYCQDEISSRDELIPVKMTGMKLHPGIKKNKRICVNTSSWCEILQWACF